MRSVTLEKLEARLAGLTLKKTVCQRRNKNAKGVCSIMYTITGIRPGERDGYFFALRSFAGAETEAWFEDGECALFLRKGKVDRERVIEGADITRHILTRYEVIAAKL